MDIVIEVEETDFIVGIIGNGPFGRSLLTRFLSYNIPCKMGSRSAISNHSINNPLIENEEVEFVLRECNVIALSIPCCAHEEFAKKYKKILKGKILIDCSNSEKRNMISNSEKLQSMLSGCSIVKAFNTLSAFEITGTNMGSVVQVCSDDKSAKKIIMNLCRSIGFKANDTGLLSSSRALENKAHNFFDNWIFPIGVSLVLLIALGTYEIVLSMTKGTFKWVNLPLLVANKVFAWHAISLMSITFLAGSIASLTQLITGTSKKRFPPWLDLWLRSRKYLGLLGLQSSFFHCVFAVISNSWFTSLDYVEDSIPGFLYQSAIFLGVLALFLFTLLGLTSIPSIGSSLSWKEWDCILSSVGIIALFTATVHALCIAIVLESSEIYDPVILSIIISMIVLLLKLILSLPCVSHKITHIRKNK